MLGGGSFTEKQALRCRVFRGGRMWENNSEESWEGRAGPYSAYSQTELEDSMESGASLNIQFLSILGCRVRPLSRSRGPHFLPALFPHYMAVVELRPPSTELHIQPQGLLLKL